MKELLRFIRRAFDWVTQGWRLPFAGWPKIPPREYGKMRENGYESGRSSGKTMKKRGKKR